MATPDGEKWVNADSLRTGDVVQVNLIITAARDIDYVAIVDNRAACLEPIDQMPAPIWAEGLCFYRENRDAATNIFISHMPKGTYRLSYLSMSTTPALSPQASLQYRASTLQPLPPTPPNSPPHQSLI